MAIYKLTDGYTIKDFLQYGLDHCQTSINLFVLNNPRTYDSSAYLFHLGLEQILKAWHLHAFGQFKDTHKLNKLLLELQRNGININLDKEEEYLFNQIDQHSAIRYPTPTQQFNLGTEDVEDKVTLVNNIVSQMPQELQEFISGIDPTQKGGRVLLMRERI